MKKSRKKIFLGWSGNQRYPAKAIELFRERGYDTIYWICTDDEGIRTPGALFHDKPDSELGLPAEGVDPSLFPPLEAGFIRSFYKEESLLLTRFNKYSTSVDEKKRLYHEMLRYWKGVLEQYRPDGIVLSCYPHPPSMYIMCSVAERMGIPTLFVHETFIGHRLLYNYNYETGAPLLASRLKENLGKDWNLQDLSDEIRVYYEKHRTERDTSPIYMKVLTGIFSRKELLRWDADIAWRALTDGSFFRRVYNAIGRPFKYSMQKEFDSLTTEPDLTVPFVYVPLHLQPEAQVSLEDVFADQTLMLEILSHELPKGWFLYVKENPFQFQGNRRTQWSPTRYPGYYKKMVALGNVRLVPLTTDTFTLIKHSRAVATVVGTASLEALFRGKPGITFGYPWFMDAPGLLRVSGPRSVREAFTLIQEGYRPDQQKMLAFLKSLGESSIRGTIDRSTPDEEGVSHEETIPRLVTFLSDEMDKLLSKPQP